MKIKRVVRSLGNTIDANSPAILTGIGVAGVLSTVALAIKSTSDAIYAINEEEARLNQYLTNRDKVELVWKLYIPTAASSALTIVAIIGSNRINTRRNAALIGLYSMADTALKEYQDKVADTIGKKKEEKIRDEIAKDKLDNNPVEGREILATGKGDCLFFDTLSGRYFRSDLETVRRIQSHVAHQQN